MRPKTIGDLQPDEIPVELEVVDVLRIPPLLASDAATKSLAPNALQGPAVRLGCITNSRPRGQRLPSIDRYRIENEAT